MSGKAWAARVGALVELADGLAALHAQSVAHRDIKPENLFELDGTYRFGDFGIAAFPDSAGVTSTNEPMGPWGYMAPEMLSEPKEAEPYKADVYSFAKTVWAVLTERKVPFGGHYSAEGPVGLSSFGASKKFVVEPLDTLLELSTRVTPSQRPSAREFADKLRATLAVQGDFERTNPLQWEAAETTALRGAGLVRAVWEGSATIAQAINTLSRRHGLNHCFFPRGGGRDRLRARFEQFLAQLNQKEAPRASWQLHRKVRLLVDGSRANHELQLEHLDLGLLERLIAADDALMAARKRKGSRGITVGSKEFEDLLREKPSEEKVAALALLRSMTKEQRAEYMTLVELARGQLEVDETSERTKVNLRGQWVDIYLLEKLGNGYMRKALEQFGLEAPSRSAS